jgi:hypothetical protein
LTTTNIAAKYMRERGTEGESKGLEYSDQFLRKIKIVIKIGEINLEK